MKLTPAQLRIVGSLIEKEMATPDNYPLTMNGLLAACNQTSNRSPVVRFDEATVSNTLENLRAMGVVRVVYSRSNRADKYRHVLHEVLALEPPDLAVLCVLMLRGPQTVSELRIRTERLHPFASVDEVEGVLDRLAERDEPLVTRLERQAGQREARWAQLLGNQPAVEAPTPPQSATTPRLSQGDRVAALEASIQDLYDRLAALRAEHEALVSRLHERGWDPEPPAGPAGVPGDALGTVPAGGRFSGVSDAASPG